jgi:hypothetical protein
MMNQMMCHKLGQGLFISKSLLWLFNRFAQVLSLAKPKIDDKTLTQQTAASKNFRKLRSKIACYDKLTKQND